MRRLFVLVLCVLMLLGIVQAVHAQEPIAPGENKLGDVTPQNPGPMFQFTSPDGLPLMIVAASNASDFAPVINVYDENFDLVQRHSNPAQTGRVSLLLMPAAETNYIVQILGVGGQHGQFVLSLSSSAESAPPMTALEIGQEVDDQVSTVEPSKQYQISAQSGQVMLIQVNSLLPDGGPAVVLSDADGNTLGVSNNALLGSAFIIPTAVGREYTITVIHSGADRREDYLVSLRPLRDAVAAEPGQVQTQAPIVATTPTPTQGSEGEVIIPFDGPCAITSKTELGINVRRGPGENYEINGGVLPGQIVVVTGRNEQITWWQVELTPGRYGWVADAAVRRGGDCSQIGVAPYDQ